MWLQTLYNRLDHKSVEYISLNKSEIYKRGTIQLKCKVYFFTLALLNYLYLQHSNINFATSKFASNNVYILLTEITEV